MSLVHHEVGQLVKLDQLVQEIAESGRGTLLGRDVEKPGLGDLAAQVGQDALAFLLAHLRVD